MATFQLKSGTLETSIQADGPRNAALWIIHQTMQQILPLYDDQQLTPRQKCRTALRRGFQVLGETVEVNERQRNARRHSFDTFDLVTEWNQLMLALAHFQNLEREPCIAVAA